MTARETTRTRLRQTLEADYKARGVPASGYEFTKELYGMYQGLGVEEPGDVPLTQAETRRADADARADAHTLKQLQFKAGGIPLAEYSSYLSSKAFNLNLLPRERRAAQKELASVETRAESERVKQEASDKKASDKEAAAAVPDDAGTSLDKKRREVERSVFNRYADNPLMRKQIGGERYQEAVRSAHKDAGVDTQEGKKKKASKGGGVGGFNVGGILEGFIGAAVVSGIGSSFGSGIQVGSAVSSLVKSLGSAVGGAASGLLAVGESIVSLILSPLGRSGQAGSKLIAGLGGLGLSILSGVTNLIASGAKTVIGGAAGLAGAIGTGGLALAGGLLGLLGGPAGVLAGAGLGAGLGALISGTVASLAQAIGGFVGSALAVVGTAFRAVGEGVSTIISSVTSTLSDLVSTGVRFSQAATGNSLMGGLSASAGLTSASLAQVLTGSASGLNQFYSSMSNMSPFIASKQAAFGIKGVNANEPTSMLMPGYNRYRELGQGPDGAIQQRIMLQSVYGGAASSMMQLFSAGPDSIRELIRVVKDNQLSPRESANNLKLQFDISGVEMRLDKLKMKLLAMFMPLIESVFPSLDKGLSNLGGFLQNKFPAMLRTGVDAIFSFGQAAASSLPAVFSYLTEMLLGFIIFAKKMAGMIAPLISSVSPTLGRDLTAFSHMPLSSMGLAANIPAGPPLSGQAAKDVTAKRDEYAGYITELQAGRGAQSEGQRKQLIAKYEALKAEQEAKLKGASGETDEGDVANIKNLPAFHRVQDYSNKAKSTLREWKVGADHALDAGSAHWGDNSVNTSRNRPEQQVVEVHVHQHDNPDGITKLETRIVNKAGSQLVRAMQHSN